MLNGEDENEEDDDDEMVISIRLTFPPLTLSTPALDVSREIANRRRRRDPPDTLRRYESFVNEEEMVRADGVSQLYGVMVV